jgi:hypothetical protein
MVSIKPFSIKQDWQLPSLHLCTSNLDPKTQKIVTIAAKAFKELAVSFALNIAILTFTAAPVLSIPVLTSALVGALVGVIISTAWDIYRSHKIKESGLSEKLSLEITAAKTNKVARIAIANAVGMSGPNIAIHEAGHAFSSLAFFKNPHPKIQILPFSGGGTSYEINGVTRLGRLLGEEKALLFTAGGGILASTIFVMLEIACAHGLKESHPALSEWLNYHAISQLLNEVIYGATAFVVSRFDLSHDFVYLHQVGGIHPLVLIAAIIAIPLAEILLLKWLERKGEGLKAKG